MIRFCYNVSKYPAVFCRKRIHESQEGNYYLHPILISKRYLQRNKVIPEYFVNHNGKTSDEKITLLGWFLLLIPVTTFGLGCWQIKRKIWKEDLIKHLQEVSQMPPVDLPNDLDDLNSMEYHAVKVRGKFLYDKELYMGPRSLIKVNGTNEAPNGLISSHSETSGYLVITPFQLADRDEIILINRGWISRQEFVNKKTRKIPNYTKDTKNNIEVIGLVRKGEQRPQFTPEHKGEIFLYRDLMKMCKLTGAKPFFLDAINENSVTEGPIGGQTRITLRNEHLSYIITWFSLSLATSIMWYHSVFKKKRF